MQAQFWKIRQHIKVGVGVWEQVMRLGRIACASSRALGVTLLKGVAYSSRLKAAPQAQRSLSVWGQVFVEPDPLLGGCGGIHPGQKIYKAVAQDYLLKKKGARYRLTRLNRSKNTSAVFLLRLPWHKDCFKIY